MPKKTPDKSKIKTPAAPPAPMNWKLVGRQQLAELMGVHPDTVTDYVRGGMPVITRGGHGKESAYNAVDCLDWQRQQTGKNAKDTAQTRMYEATAKINELKLEREQGELVRRDQVILEGQHYTKAWSAKVRGLPRRLVNAGVVAREREAAAAGLCLELLTEISSWSTVGDAKRAAKATDAS